jgi:uncharacterized protein (TIGR03545 family)
MTRWIRWWGLAVFVLLVAVLVGGTVLFADRLVKGVVEAVGSSTNGAKVELQSASLSFNPLGFVLDDLQVTDAHEPMRNVVQIQRIKFALDGYALLHRKVVVTDLSAEGVRTNIPRASSGALPQLPEPEPEANRKPRLLDSFSFPQVDLPDAKQLLAANDFTSTKLVEQGRAELDQAKEHWIKRLAELPDSTVLKSFDERIQQARPNLNGNALHDAQEIAEGIKRLQAVRDDIDKDVERIKTARDGWDTDWAIWKQHSKDLLAAPGLDLDHLKGKYSLDAKGFANASRAMFGGQIAQWTDTGLYWYDKAKPLLSARAEQEAHPQRGKGIDVHFIERDQLPGFLIRSAKLSVEVPAGILSGEIRNITNDQVALGHPLTFNFFAEKMQGVQDLELEGVFNHVVPGASVDSARFKIHGVAVQRFDVLRQPRFPVALSDAMVDVDASALQKNGVLQGELNANFKSVKLSVDLNDSAGELERLLAAALADVRRFTVKAQLQGSLNDYDVALNSDLDELLRAALNKQFRARIDKFVAEVKAQLDAKVQDARKELDAKLGDLKGIGGIIDQRHKQADDVQQKAEQELRAAADKARQRVEELQAAKEKAKQESDKLRERLKDQLGF